MALITSISTNDETLKELYLTDKPDVYFTSTAEFKAALNNNVVLERIHLGGDFTNGLSRDDTNAVMEQIGKLPALKEVHLWSTNCPLEALIALLQNSKRLETFEMGMVTLSGSNSELQDFGNCLAQIPSISEISLMGFRIEASGVQLTSFLKVIGSIKTLSALRLAAMSDTNMSLSSSVLMKVLENTSLRELHLSLFKLGKPHIGVLSWGIERNNLKVLGLPNTGFDDIAAHRLAASLESSTLESLDLSNNDELTNEGISLIADSLAGNRHLKVLKLGGCKNIGAAGLAAIAKVTDKSSTLQHVQTPATVEAERRGVVRDAAEKQANQANVRAKAA